MPALKFTSSNLVILRGCVLFVISSVIWNGFFTYKALSAR